MNAIIEEMSLEEKLGQLFMTTYENDSVSTEMINLITKYHIGSVLLTSPNLADKKQLTHLTNYMQYYATNKRPLIIASKQESEYENDLVVMPNEETLLGLNNPLYTKQLAEIIAVEHRSLGINTIFYPNVTVNNNLEIKKKAQHGVAIIQGMKKGFIANSILSFPRLHEINFDFKPDSKRSTLYPFYKAIQENVGMITISELSERLITNVLRESLSFENVISYEINNSFSSVRHIANEIIEAIHAGVNMIVLPFTYEQQLDLLNYLLELAKQNKINQSKIDDSVRRLLELKRAYRMGEFITSENLKMKDFYVKRVKEKIMNRLDTLEVN